MRLPTKPGPLPTTTPTFFRRLAIARAVAIVSRDVWRPPYDLKQPHHVRRAKKMKTDHTGGALGDASELVNTQRRSVRSENAAWFHDRIELLEHRSLELHVFEDGFNHEVCRLKARKVELGV